MRVIHKIRQLLQRLTLPVIQRTAAFMYIVLVLHMAVEDCTSARSTVLLQVGLTTSLCMFLLALM